MQKSHRLTEFQDFDNASRGPTGSLVLLGKLRGIHLVSLGAFITIATIAFGPVSQQAVSFPLRWQPDDDANATLSRATFFTAAGMMYILWTLFCVLISLPESAASLDGISVALSAALQSGFAREKISYSAVIPTCHTVS